MLTLASDGGRTTTRAMARRLSSSLDCRITPQQHDALTQWAAATGFRIADLVRELLPTTPPGPEDADYVEQLRERIAESLHQERDVA